MGKSTDLWLPFFNSSIYLYNNDIKQKKYEDNQD